ncbi:MAG TPA: hypothetical protein VE465_11670 [Streptosporangiaceae bacterium]|nr:hypothetical protein [Streptosporangiaceae bacterium]
MQRPPPATADLSPQPPREAADSPDYGGQLDRDDLPVADVLRASVEPLPLTLLIGSLGLAVYAASLRIISPSACGDLRTLFVRVLGVRRLIRARRNSPQQV